MENKINVAELLKDCPKGMELDCSMYENVEFDYIEQSPESAYPIHCLMKINGGYNALVFTHNGRNDRHPNAKCVIFPKGKTTWEGFIPPCKFKDGDVISDSLGTCIFKGEGMIQGTVDYYCGVHGDYFNIKWNHDGHYGNIVDYRFATEEEKEKLFQAIKDNGYKWNAETMTLEKLVKPKFKVDDKIKLRGGDEFGIITQVADYFYTIKCKNNTHCWPIKKQDDWELIDEPKFKVGDRIIHKVNKTSPFTITEITGTSYKGGSRYEVLIEQQDNFELVQNKFDITTLKPFDRVLVRDYDEDMWCALIFSHTWKNKYFCAGVWYNQCISYEGNEHLLGTTNDCDEFYKTWE